MKRYFFIIVLIVIASCTKEVKISLPEQEGAGVVNCLFTNDSIFNIKLNYSCSPLESYNKAIQNAIIYLYKGISKNYFLDAVVYTNVDFCLIKNKLLPPPLFFIITLIISDL